MVDVLGWVVMVVAATPPFMTDLRKLRIAMICSGTIGGVYTTMLGSIPLTILNCLAVGLPLYHLSKPLVLGLTQAIGFGKKVDSHYEVEVGSPA